VKVEVCQRCLLRIYWIFNQLTWMTMKIVVQNVDRNVKEICLWGWRKSWNKTQELCRCEMNVISFFIGNFN
jgi:hypothetical protein